MKQLQRNDLWSLEEYAEQRSDFRRQVIEHKKNRQVDLGNNARLYFEDRLTIQYQIQEMLRIERIFEAAGIQEELDAYNPLIPTGTNWKATFMLEYPEPDERKTMLEKLVGVEDKVWVKIGNSEKIFAIADEDLDRSNDDKTSSVHFLRFELDLERIAELSHGANIIFGIDQAPFENTGTLVDDKVKQSLLLDLQTPATH